jgi:hypothetical protein
MQKVDLFGVLETISGGWTPYAPDISSSKTPNKKVSLESERDSNISKKIEPSKNRNFPMISVKEMV